MQVASELQIAGEIEIGPRSPTPNGEGARNRLDGFFGFWLALEHQIDVVADPCARPRIEIDLSDRGRRRREGESYSGSEQPGDRRAAHRLVVARLSHGDHGRP